MKVGTVALIGRPNTGKSTLVNNLVGHKVAITSPKPQTTQFPIYAVYEDTEAGNGVGMQVIFVDTPGIFAKNKDASRKGVNLEAEKVLHDEVDAILYIVDHTRQRGSEENRVLGILRKLKIPKILVINKIDLKEPDYSAQYKFMEDEFDTVLQVSALKPMNLGAITAELFEILPEGEALFDKSELSIPALNVSPTLHMEELIREKVFLTLRKEVPYHVKVVVDEITERPAKQSRGKKSGDKVGLLYVRARILTEHRYKKMIIGANAQRIKQIGSMTRRELELSTGKKFYLELTVEIEK
ncbi:MAG TPA: GTPase Era [Candidatus Levybacteria bacterium]|nr:GTPase Era [Candidatus Levybacteria bacterium]